MTTMSHPDRMLTYTRERCQQLKRERDEAITARDEWRRRFLSVKIGTCDVCFKGHTVVYDNRHGFQCIDSMCQYRIDESSRGYDSEQESPIISRVYVLPNRMVAVFDRNGQQIPEYQGPLDEVREKIAAAFPESQWSYG